MSMLGRLGRLAGGVLLAAAIVGCGDDEAPPDDGVDSGVPLAVCGNAEWEEGETCDDGNTVDGDGCSADCSSDERCGNGIVDDPAGEVCDDANTRNGDGCNADCTSDETCGNGVVDLGVGEVCDDGNEADGDGCSADCLEGPVCGDGLFTPPEACDDGNTTGGDGCSADCSSDETCGNGVLDSGEACDDGNLDPGDGCGAACALERCGNGLPDGGEQCDDGNSDDGDGCDNDCRYSCAADADCDDGGACNGGETCSPDTHACVDGADLPDGTDCGGGRVCRAGACADASCGNAQVEGKERCDDGNAVPGDGCENDCTWSCEQDADCDDGLSCDGAETCAAHVCQAGVPPAEGTVCDRDGDGATRDLCLAGICGPSTCGDSWQDAGATPPEACDDGNVVAGDGCEPDCTLSGPGPTAFRVISLRLIDPHIYVNFGRLLGCRDLTDSGFLGTDSVNDQIQASVDAYGLNYVLVFRPLDIDAATNPMDFVDGECVAGPPADCQVGAGTVYPTTANNDGAGATCLSADPAHLNANYAAPNEVTGPCFATDPTDITVDIVGVLLPFLEARVGATYSGLPVSNLISGLIVGFLSEQAAQDALLPDSLPGIGGDPLYEHLAAGGAAGSSCSGRDDRDTRTLADGSTETGFWFYIDFTAERADWTD